MKEFLAVAFLVFWLGVILFLADRARANRERVPDRDRPVQYAFGVIPVRLGNRRRTSPLAALIIFVVIIMYALYRFAPHH
jgi:uncharacterized membrane protein